MSLNTAYQREYYRKHKEEYAERQRKSRANHPERHRRYAANSYKALKIEVLEAYGGCKCSCPGCEVTHLAFLSIDHINNDGAEHRRIIRNKGGTTMYRWLKSNGFPAGYQVLCHNCNQGRHVNGGQCPHVNPDGRWQ